MCTCHQIHILNKGPMVLPWSICVSQCLSDTTITVKTIPVLTMMIFSHVTRRKTLSSIIIVKIYIHFCTDDKIKLVKSSFSVTGSCKQYLKLGPNYIIYFDSRGLFRILSNKKDDRKKSVTLHKMFRLRCLTGYEIRFSIQRLDSSKRFRQNQKRIC